MKVIFMGTPDFAVSTLEALVREGHEVILAVTQPDKPKGRGKNMQFPPVKETAIAHNIPVYQPRKIRETECIEYLKDYPADVIVVVAFGQILPKEILDMPKYGCINVHASLLPKYRGAAPIQWAVIDGEEESGVTTMQMGVGLDTGDMLKQCRVKLEKDETGGSLFDRLSEAGAQLLIDTLKDVEAGTITPVPQDDSLSTYAGMIRKDMGRIDWTKDAVVIERLIRGLNPWPSAFTSFNGKTLKIWQADVLDRSGEAGMILEVTKDRIIVGCGKGSLALGEIQLEGKRRMAVKDFLLGYHPEEGSRLGET